jgi:hypothetical protein
MADLLPGQASLGWPAGLLPVSADSDAYGAGLVNISTP